MGYFSDVIGNDTVKMRMAQLIRQNKLPHALILEGPKGSGKGFFARRLAAALLCQNRADQTRDLPCMHCSACRKEKTRPPLALTPFVKSVRICTFPPPKEKRKSISLRKPTP